MTTMTLTTKYVNPPAEGKTQATIKDTQNQMYGYFPDKVSMQPNVTYEVEYNEREYNGKTFRTITKAVQKSTGNGTAGAGGNGHERMIFITGVVGRAMGGGGFSVSDIKNLALAAAEAFDALQKGEKPPQSMATELNDEIPF